MGSDPHPTRHAAPAQPEPAGDQSAHHACTGHPFDTDSRDVPTRPGLMSRLGHHVRQPAVRIRLMAVGALVTVSGVVATVNPTGSAPYPQCPTRALLGFDCPACGGLRGTHALVQGRLDEAFDYNLLLPLLLITLTVPLVLWALPLVGRSAVRFDPPRWLVVGLVAVFAVFSVLRNLPFPAFEPLAADLTW